MAANALKTSPKRGWLLVIALLIAAGGFLIFDSAWRLRELDHATKTSVLSDTPPPRKEYLAREEVLPGGGLDARWWIIHTQQLIKSGQWRVRFTAQDNAPFGREVHWSSLPVWTLAGLSAVVGGIRGISPESAVPQASMYFGPVLLLVFLFLACPWTFRTFGALSGLLLLLGSLALFPFYSLFRVGETDHHGLASVAALMTLLPLVALLGRWPAPIQPPVRPRELLGVPSLVWLSALSGAIGLWISAATAIPILAVTFLSIAICTWIFDRNHAILPSPEIWTRWSLIGAVASLGFYLLEYFPGHMGLRLEVNHPLFACAWLAGGIILSHLCLFLRGEKKFFPTSPLQTGMLIAACGAILLPPILILVNGTEWFWIADRFLYDFHRFYISEFLSYPEFFASQKRYLQSLVDIATIAFTVSLSFWTIRRKKVPLEKKAALVFILIPTIALAAATFAQLRWLATAIPVCLGCLLVAAAILWEQFREKNISRQLLVVWGGGVVILLSHYPIYSLLTWKEKTLLPFAIHQSLWPELAAKDVAVELARRYPGQSLTVLSGPNASTNLAYYGGFKTLGTLYWENREGLRAASRIYAAADEATALALLQKHKVTHLIFFSWDAFGRRYVRLARDLGKDAMVNDGFIAGLLEGTRSQPLWLRPIFFPLDEKVHGQHLWVRIYEVVPNQTPSEWFYHVGLYQLEAGLMELAGESFQKSLAKDTGNAKAGIACARLLFLMGRSDDALEALTFTLNHSRDGENEALSLADNLRTANSLSEAKSVYQCLLVHANAQGNQKLSQRIKDEIAKIP